MFIVNPLNFSIFTKPALPSSSSSLLCPKQGRHPSPWFSHHRCFSPLGWMCRLAAPPPRVAKTPCRRLFSPPLALCEHATPPHFATTTGHPLEHHHRRRITPLASMKPIYPSAHSSPPPLTIKGRATFHSHTQPTHGGHHFRRAPTHRRDCPSGLPFSLLVAQKVSSPHTESLRPDPLHFPSPELL